MSPLRRWSLLAVASTGLLLITLDNSILYTALPTVTNALGASAAESLWIINAYPLVMAGLLLGSGTLADRVGHRRMFLIGLAVFGLASMGAAFAPTAGLLIAARAALAVGAAAMMPATLALIRLAFHIERERNIAIAVWGSVSVLGIAAGPILSGALLERFWWGSVFLVNVPVAAAAIVATVLIAPVNDPDSTKRWDAMSSLQAMAALTGAVFLIKEVAGPAPRWTVLFAAAAVTGIASTSFVRRQRRSPQPLLAFTIFRNPAFSAGVVAAAVAMFTLAGVQLVLTQRFQLLEGFTPLQAGLLVAAIAVGSLPTSLIGGAVLHRVGLRVLIAGGFAVMFVGMSVLTIGFLTTFAVVVVGLVVLGVGAGAAMSVASTAIVGNVAPRRAGMASAVEEVSYEFGSLIAVAMLGSVLTAVFSATVHLPPGAPAAAGEGLSDAVTASSNPAVVAAASDAFGAAALVVLVIVAAAVAVAAVATAVLLRRHGPGTPAWGDAQQQPGAAV